MTGQTSHNKQIDNFFAKKLTQSIGFNSKNLQYLLVLGYSRSISEAADELNITQSALSQAIATLEDRWGIPLVEKDGRKRTLTEAGQKAVEFASAVFSRADEFQDWLQIHKQGESGTLRVGMTDSANLYILPGALKSFRKVCPEVKVSIIVDSSKPLWNRLRSHELDLAFTIGSDDDFWSEEIVKETLYIYGSKTGNNTNDNTEWALYPSNSETRKKIDRGLAEAGIVPHAILESGNPEVLAQMVKLGFCSSVLPRQKGLDKLMQQPVAVRAFTAVRRASSPPDQRIDTLIRLCKETSKLADEPKAKI